MWTISKEFSTRPYLETVRSPEVDPADCDWEDLKEDARSCAQQSELQMTWDSKNEYLLIGTPIALEQFESIAEKAASRLGNAGPYCAASLLERLRQNSPAFESDDSIETEGSDSWMIEAVFPALTNLFMRYEAMRGLKRNRSADQSRQCRQAAIDEIKRKINEALAGRNIKEAVSLGLDVLKARGEKPTKTAIYGQAQIDRAEFYRIMRNENLPASAPYQRLERVLTNL